MGIRARAALLTLLVLGLASCGDQTPARRRARREARQHQQRPTGRIVVLPDSAIVVQPGSIDDQLARYLASPLPAPRTFRFAGTEFAAWESKPNEPTLRTMYAIVQILRAYPKAAVTLVGYTDDDGSIDANRTLAQARVDRVGDMLVAGGVASRRITKLARPKTDYIAPNDSDAGRARNRRVELIVTTK